MLAFYMSLTDDLSSKEKIEKIYTQYYGLMMHVASEYIHVDAEDVVHDAMIKIIKNIDKVDISDEIKTKAFCSTIVRNRAIDCLRKNNKDSVSYDDNILPKNEFTYDIAKIEETYQLIYAAIESLSDTYRTVCMLKYVNGLKEREIAEILDLPAKTVSLRIYRGKQILKEILGKEDEYGK